WKLLDAWLPKRCDLVTCLSEDTRRDVVARCPESDHDDNVVIPMGIDLARIDRVQTGRDALRKRLGIADDEVLVLFAGVAIARKGISEAVDAWRSLGEEGKRARLLFLSKPVDPVEAGRISDLVSSDRRVAHLPAVPYEEMPDYYRAADVFFFPTRREGFGIVVAEAMACGLPVVTTRARGVREVVVEGETALQADVQDRVGLARALGRAIADPALRERLGKAGRARVERVFSWGPILDRLMAKLSETPLP
ncbi:MAG TPA: glycosyltransferase family 4 protein, partial [Thermoanaerobaculia bacterium]